MDTLLVNPVYNALISGDQHLGFGEGKARSFYEEVSPFAGFEEGYSEGFKTLYELLPHGRRILYAIPAHIETPPGWKLLQHVGGIQMIFEGKPNFGKESVDFVPLTTQHVDQMLALTKLTNPGPFATRTIEFGRYFGIFETGRLVAMAGERMHVQHFTEVSAVCTHPEYLGRGYASALMRHQVHLILDSGQVPFLHVRADNTGAIKIYERLGFKFRRPMNFYFMGTR